MRNDNHTHRILERNVSIQKWPRKALLWEENPVLRQTFWAPQDTFVNSMTAHDDEALLINDWKTKIHPKIYNWQEHECMKLQG